MQTRISLIYGIFLTLFSSFCYVLMGFLAKGLRTELSFPLLLFLQSTVGFFFAFFYLIKHRYNFTSIFQQRAYYLPRSLYSCGSTFLLLLGLKSMSLFNALVILNTAPFFLPLIRKILYQKNFSQSIYLALGVAFLGLVLILSPDRDLCSKSFILIFGSMLCLVFSLLMLENPKTFDFKLIIFYYFACSTFFSSIFLISHTPPLFHTSSLLLAGCTGFLLFIVQWSIVYASRLISALLISVLFYTEIIMALVGSIWLENFTPTFSHYLGSVFILLGGFAVAWLEHKKQ